MGPVQRDGWRERDPASQKSKSIGLDSPSRIRQHCIRVDIFRFKMNQLAAEKSEIDANFRCLAGGYDDEIAIHG
jgi:hypothetical protein